MIVLPLQRSEVEVLADPVVRALSGTEQVEAVVLLVFMVELVMYPYNQQII